MPNPPSPRAGADALMFRYRFQVGNLLRVTQLSQLRIQAEQHFDEIRLFLDPGGFVEGIEERADRLNVNMAIGPDELSTGEIRAIPTVAWHREPRSPALGGALAGLTLILPAGTELGLSPTGSSPADSPLRLRFPEETRIQVGSREETALGRYNLRGLTPVLLNGIPFLELTSAQQGSLELNWHGARTAILSILGIISPYRRRGQDALYHVMEALGDRVVGGASILIRA